MARGEIYVQLAVNFASDPKVRALARFGRGARPARDLYVNFLCFLKENLTDGFIPREQIGILVYPDTVKTGLRDAAHLVEVGLVVEVDGGYLVPGFLKRNKSKAQVDALAEVRAEAGRRGGTRSGLLRRAEANAKQVASILLDPDAKQVASRGLEPIGHRSEVIGQRSELASLSEASEDPSPVVETSKSEVSTPSPESSDSCVRPGARRKLDEPGDRDDVERVCQHLADRLEQQYGERPNITKTNWRQAARYLLDIDKRPEDRIHAAIDWCQDDEFWRVNIRSVSSLRKQYLRLRAAAEAERKRGSLNGRSTTNERVQQGLDLVSKYKRLETASQLMITGEVA